MHPAPAPAPEESPAPAAPKLWRVGTLTYTGGALAVLCLWLLWGDFAYFLKTRSVVPTMKLLLRTLDAPDLVIGVLLGFLPQTLALLVVPVVSHHSDRHRGRRGRRIPFLLIPTPFVALAMIGIGYGPHLGRILHGHTLALGWSETTAMLAVVAVFWTVYELGSTICDTVFYALFNDVVPKAVMGRFIAMFRMVTFIDGIIFNYFILGHAETHFTLIFAGIGVFYGISFTLMCLNVKEGRYPPPPPPTGRSGLPAVLGGYWRDCFGNGYYVWIFACLALITISTQPINLFVIFFAKQLAMDMDHYGKFAALQMTLSFALTLPVGWLVDRFHPVRISMLAMGLLGVISLWSYLAVDTPKLLGVAVVAVGAAAGLVQTAATPLANLLFPSAAFSRLYGAATLVKLAGLAGTALISGWFLDHSGHAYRFIYLWSAIGAAITMLTLAAVWHRMRAYGGLKNYAAPPIDADRQEPG